MSQAQLGSLGGGNAVRLSMALAKKSSLDMSSRPAEDIASGAEVALPDGALVHANLVSLPVIAEPDGS